jgi:hypothetical protein
MKFWGPRWPPSRLIQRPSCSRRMRHCGEHCDAAEAFTQIKKASTHTPGPSYHRKDQPKSVRFGFWFPQAPDFCNATRGGRGNTPFLLSFRGSKETSDENYNRYPRYNFPRRHSGSGKVGEFICAWAPCNRSSRSLILRARPRQKAQGPAKCADGSTGP